MPDVASWGSAEEIVTAVRMKKPIFISMEGGKKATPLWMMGMVPHHYIYDSVEDIIEMIKSIFSCPFSNNSTIRNYVNFHSIFIV